MVQPILPSAHHLFLCERYIVRDRGKVDFLGAFHTISPPAFPHVHPRLFVVAHLGGGLGVVNTYLDVRHAESDELVATTAPRQIMFPDRDVLVRLALEFRSIPFPQPGIYFFQLCCEHTVIADIRVRLREPATSPGNNRESVQRVRPHLGRGFDPHRDRVGRTAHHPGRIAPPADTPEPADRAIARRSVVGAVLGSCRSGGVKWTP